MVVLNIPLAILFSIVCLWLTGQTINLMTLGGLALAVGILVDEATVEIENIHTQMRKSKSIALAVWNGNHQTAIPRLLAMLCILAVFVPTFFMQGAPRELFYPLSLAVGFAIIGSHILSSTLVPILCIWLLRDKHAGKPTEVSQFLVKWFDNFIGSVIGLRWIVVPVYLTACALLVWMTVSRVGVDIFPNVDAGEFRIRLRAQDGTHIDVTEKLAIAVLELIRWNSDQRLLLSESQLVPIELVAEGNTPQGLIALALSNRPELAESRHLVGEAVERLKREQHAPLVPSVLLAASYGGLGGGLGGNLSNYGDRLDADAVAFWEMRQLGFGERAAQREARSRITQARMRELATMDRIALEVNETQAQIQARKKQIEISKEAVQAANDSFEKNWERIRNGQGLPIEALQSIQAPATAQREYIRAVSEYNTAQFTLQRSLEWPISDTQTDL